MAVYIGWIILLWQPRYVLVGAVSAAIVALGLIPFLVGADLALLPSIALNTAISIAIFAGVGCAIVAVRKWMKQRSQSKTEAMAEAAIAELHKQSPPT